MPVTSVVTPATVRRPFTFDLARAALGIPPDKVSDTILGLWVDGVTGAIEGLLGRPLAQERVVETVLADGPILHLARTPVVEITSVTVGRDERVLDPASYELTDAFHGRLRILERLDDVPGYYDALMSREHVVSWGIGRYDAPRPCRMAVDYTGGWVLPGADGAPPLPADLQLAALEGLRAFRQAQDRISGVQSERLGDYSYVLAQQATATARQAVLTPEVTASLERYKPLAMA